MPVVDLHQDRAVVIRIVFAVATLVLVVWLLRLQVLDNSLRNRADLAGVSRETSYPARGLFFDRNGKLLVVNTPLYDLMVTFSQFEKQKAQFDTAKFCRLLGITPEYFVENMTRNWRSERFSKSVPFVFLSKVSPQQYAAFQESLFEFPGFSMQLRNARGYPHRHAAHVLGYIGEIGPKELADSIRLPDSSRIYAPGDYVGASGLEKWYETFLRGEKGVSHILKDNLGRNLGPYANGALDRNPRSGYDLFTTIDLDLQAYGEQLMANKIGSIVAIEPATGEILAMVSAPTYDPSLLVVGQQRGQAFSMLLTDSLRPFLDRSVQGLYPPGSLFKPLVALIGLQEGTLTADRGVSCGGAYVLNGQRLTGCHGHPHCSNVETAIQYSCNAYFVTVFREAIDQYSDESTPRKGLNTFNDYLYRFGLGNPLQTDFPGEQAGNVPTSDYYDGVYAKETGWKSIWIRSLGIGQGEYQMTNLQMANLAAAIANRGYYITPHLVRHLRDEEGHTQVPPLTKLTHQTGIEARHFEPVVNGMEKVVQAGTARIAFLPDISICGKTGTAENNQGSGKDHSIFFAFAPKDNPKIAIAVYVENGGWGGSYAAPIASLMIEKYLTGKIRPERAYLEQRMFDTNLIGTKP